jgi:hypothetical protein
MVSHLLLLVLSNRAPSRPPPHDQERQDRLVAADDARRVACRTRGEPSSEEEEDEDRGDYDVNKDARLARALQASRRPAYAGQQKAAEWGEAAGGGGAEENGGGGGDSDGDDDGKGLSDVDRVKAAGALSVARKMPDTLGLLGSGGAPVSDKKLVEKRRERIMMVC